MEQLIKDIFTAQAIEVTIDNGKFHSWNRITLISLISSQRGWNKHGGGAKVPELINKEVGINVEGGIFGNN